MMVSRLLMAFGLGGLLLVQRMVLLHPWRRVTGPGSLKVLHRSDLSEASVRS